MASCGACGLVLVSSTAAMRQNFYADAELFETITIINII
ncbi:hypothetical protein CBM2592_B100381 [Cupriavidus taiwanensis]|nr:hypothetical protein CBM2592_B100381 [Cupriavidus taiwanensis]SOY63110.1 hypothetical protein CBM2588_B130042 [Cupriavidus taiwanensis]SOY98167.1 hypothetical protein CBM2591_B80382 [Cupriavidus taiwanensis]SOZ85236.1 hypothetical protein CBM2618_B130058 [Cupriavidus taiwanensis]SOZ88691.1 hypothetical protein CBM2622_B140060 [Cupriavidus taiwanensis]